MERILSPLVYVQISHLPLDLREEIKMTVLFFVPSSMTLDFNSVTAGKELTGT